MRLLLPLTVVASAAIGALAADELKIDVTQEVECERKTQKGDSIEVHYRGTLAANGNKFDASYDRGTPFGFKLGGGQVIKGWDQGLLDMCIGEKRTLTVPPEYGYGNRGMGPIPAGSTLIFETELIGIKGVPKPETIVIKTATSTSTSTSTATAASETPEASSPGLIEKVVGAVKTMLGDNTDDTQEHNEL